jgi:peptide/nickel transport system substrate-binding protein
VVTLHRTQALFLRLGLAALLSLAVAPLWAGTLRIGISSDTTSIDPHFAEIGTNIVVRQHVFDSLVDVGPDMTLRPGLATSWQPTADPLVWDIALREGGEYQGDEAAGEQHPHDVDQGEGAAPLGAAIDLLIEPLGVCC